MKDCIFCQIVNGKTDTDLIYENDKVVAFKDVNPQAPVHILIVSRKHIPSVKELQEEDRDIVTDMIWAAKEIAERKELTGYRLKIHVGRSAGQEIDHLHLHLLSNNN